MGVFARAENNCFPASSVICTISDNSLNDDCYIRLDDSVQLGINFWNYEKNPKTKNCVNSETRTQAIANARKLANDLVSSNVCRFVVDQTVP
jgi:hypothetical protein